MSMSPYPGLRPFREDEADCFFGRDVHVRELLRKLDTGRFLAVVGPSGCGKTSLIEAGLIPSLFAVTPSLKVIRVRFGAEPLVGLARNLVRTYPSLAKGYYNEQEAASVTWARVRNGPQDLVEIFGSIPERDRGIPMIVVDPFEDLLRARGGAGAGEVESLVAALLAVAQDERARPVRVVIALRADTLGECSTLPGLPDALNRGFYLLSELSPIELAEAIERPARVQGAAVAEDLVRQLVQDVVTYSGLSSPLPLFQHTLMRIWARATEAALPSDDADDVPGVQLTAEHYRDVGRLDCLAKDADSAYAELQTDRQRRIAETMFRQLCGRIPIALEALRSVRVQEVASITQASVEEVKAVIEVFRRPERALLMPPAHVPLLGDMDLQIGHEALIRHWNRLDRWLGDRAFDIFLCHNSQDKTRVRQIAGTLRDRGFLVWLDDTILRPGMPSTESLEKALRSIRSAAVFVGKGGIGPWQRKEYSVLLRQSIKRALPVIPVILEDCPVQEPDLPDFLQDYTWIDFRKLPPDHPDPLARLIYGISGQEAEDPQPAP